MPHSPLVSLPGSKIAGRLAQCPPLFGIGNSRFNGPGDRKRNLVLHSEDISQITIVTLRPDVDAGFCIDKLRVDADPLTAATHAAFQDIAHAKFTSDLLHVDRMALVGEAGIAGDDEQPADAR